MKNYVIGFWNSNLGDDLFLKILCDRYPDQNFVSQVYSNAQGVLEDIDNLKVVPYKNQFLSKVANRFGNFLNRAKPTALGDVWPSPIWQMENFLESDDNIIEIGGSIFPMDPNSKGGGRALRKREVLRDQVKHYIILGSNFGPFYTQQQIDEYNDFFKTIDSVTFRDEYSYSLFADNPQTHVAPDIVFSFKNNADTQPLFNGDYSVVSVVDPKVKAENTSPYVISLYQRLLVQAISERVADGDDVVLMSFCDEQGDLEYAKEILTVIPDEIKAHVHLFSHSSINDSVNVLAHAQAIFASRFHAMVLGWILEKPTFVASYGEKTKHTLTDVFPEQQHVELTEDSTIPAHIEYSTLKHEEVRRLNQEAQRQFAALDKLFK